MLPSVLIKGVRSIISLSVPYSEQGISGPGFVLQASLVTNSKTATHFSFPTKRSTNWGDPYKFFTMRIHWGYNNFVTTSF